MAAKTWAASTCHAMAPTELLLVSGCRGHADWSRPSVDAAGSCSYLSDCMSLSAYRHLLRALCWLAWCSRQTSGAAARSKTDEADARLLWATSEHLRHVHHMRAGADDVTGLLIGARTASTHANRPWQRRPGLQAPAIRWQPEELLLVSGCSGHADRSRPIYRRCSCLL